MTTTTQTDAQTAFVERVFDSLRGAFDIFAIYLGDKLGYYRALAAGPRTSAELAKQTQTDERYAREWLEQQATTGILTVDDASAPAADRRYALAPGVEGVLADRESLDFVAPIAQLFAGAVSPLDQLVQAYRTGAGVPYADYGPELVAGQAAINRGAFLYQLGQEWLPALPAVHARLQSEPPARVADIGCGAGWSSIGMAQCYPNARVDGFDLDAPSIELARKNVREYGVSDRVDVQVRDAGEPALAGRYDLVTAFECVHDMADPVAALRTMRRLAADGGTVLIADERVADRFMGDGNDVEWMMYGWSILHCLPVGRADTPSAATGTVMRLPQLEAYAKDAGFSKVEVAPIDNFLFCFYVLTP